MEHIYSFFKNTQHPVNEQHKMNWKHLYLSILIKRQIIHTKKNGKVYPYLSPILHYLYQLYHLYIHWELSWASLCYILGGVLMSKYGPAFKVLIPYVGCIFRLMKLPLILHHKVAPCKVTDIWYVCTL